MACPVCHKDDRIEKVSALVSTGTASSGLFRSQTDIAAKLVAPSRPPAYEGPWGCFSVGFVILSFAAFLIFLGIFLWYASVPGGRPLDVVQELLVTLALAVIAIFVIIHHVPEAKRRKEAAILTSRQHEEAYNIWNKLYYCYRDDVVFRQDNPNVYAAASQMSKLLYSS